jgi:glycosyltransferase involved in cell wall biosynthesis
MFNLARGLVSAGHWVTVITHDQNPISCPGVGIVSVPVPASRRTIGDRAWHALGRLAGVRHAWSLAALDAFEKIGPVDIIETAEYGAWGWQFIDHIDTPLAVRCHNPAHVVWSINQEASTKGILPPHIAKQDILEREQAYRADGLAAPSRALAYHLSLNWTIPLRRFHVIPNPIDAELFRPNGTDRRDILYVGRLEYNKGVFDLAEALAPVLREHPGVCVHFVGMDLPAPSHLVHRGLTAVEVIRAMVPKELRDRLLFTPHVPVAEIAQLQQKALLSVMPTRGFESFSYTAVEAMACGTPVIATRCGGPGEIITDGIDGLLVSPGQPAELARAMRSLLADGTLRQRIGAAGRRTVETRYSISAVVPRVVDWYSDVIREHKRA